MSKHRADIFIYSLLAAMVIATSILVWTSDTKAAGAQNTNCIGSAEYLSNRQLASQALSTQIDPHKDIYAKDSTTLTPEDLHVIANDILFYAEQLAQIEAPSIVKAVAATEIAMYYTLAAMLYSTGTIPGDLSTIYNDAGSSLSAAITVHADYLVSSCEAYTDLYAGYLTSGADA